jgi:hypothetical protein
VMHLSAGTRLVPTAAILNVWAHCVDYYLPFRGAWLLVSAACVFAAIEGLRGRVVGFVAAWWALTSLGVLRYAATLSEWPDHPVPSWLNTSQLALPSLLLVAWVIASIADGRLPVLRRLGARTRAGGAVAVLVILTTLMMRQAYATLQRDEDELVRFVSPPLSACRALKAAAFYVRSHDGALPYVFQLSSDVYLGHIGEFYYGLSYGRSSRPEDPNHLLDFGLHAYGRKYPPQAFYRAYEVPRFEYYVDFTADHVADEDGFKASVVSRLLGEGANVVCTITDAGRPIGRILSFRDEGPVQLDARAASKSWDRQFGHARTLLLQPLAGTAYHFGYNWRKLE